MVTSSDGAESVSTGAEADAPAPAPGTVWSTQERIDMEAALAELKARSVRRYAALLQCCVALMTPRALSSARFAHAGSRHNKYAG
jgi:hypothetical protein